MAHEKRIRGMWRRSGGQATGASLTTDTDPPRQNDHPGVSVRCHDGRHSECLSQEFCECKCHKPDSPEKS